MILLVLKCQDVATHQSSLKMYLLPHLYDYVSNLVLGVLNGIELELAYNFPTISCSIPEICQAEVYHQHIGL